MAIRINSLQLENVKRIKAVKLDLTGNALTVIGGNNKQGKTSVLDAIAWCIGGDRFKPSNPNREDSVIPAEMIVELSNGIVVERKGKNGTLKVTDPSGARAGQSLLNSFIEQLALNLPKFLQQNSQDKARTLLQIVGVEDQLLELEKKEKELYNRRHSHGQFADSRRKYADELPAYPDAPAEPVSVSQMIQEQQTILARNGQNQQLRNNLESIEQQATNKSNQVAQIKAEIQRLQASLQTEETAEKELYAKLNTAKKSAEQLQDESTAELQEKIQNAETINEQVKANQAKAEALQEADTLQEQYDELSAQLENVRKQKIELLNSADLPLPGLSVEDGNLTYLGQQWDNMSGSDQLKVSTAIVRKLNPECGFILLDKLEQMDKPTLQAFGQWAESENLQIIATRVSTGDECSVIIEDGSIKPTLPVDPALSQKTINSGNWEPGKF